jgi:type II secretory pathway pseudopilin PulG
MKSCPNCSRANDDSAAFCNNCGANLAAATPASPLSNAQRTSGLAVTSLIFGIFFFVFPFAVTAVVLGHVARSQIKKSAGRLRGNGISLAGMILGYSGLAMDVIILIIAAVAIPNLVGNKMGANEATAISNLRRITEAVITYRASYGQYPSGLTALGPPLAGHGPDANGAGLIDGLLMYGSESGYAFTYRQVSTSDAEGGFDVSADPITPGATGRRHFHDDESAVIRVAFNRPATRASPRL